MRCPDCNKFVSYELNDTPEDQSLEVDDQGHITAEYRLVLNCGECGTELKELTETVDADVPDEWERKHHGESVEGVVHELSVEASTEEVEEISKVIPPKTKRGREKTVTLYQLHIEVEVSCSCNSHKEDTVMVDLRSEGQEASAFEECC